MHYQCSTRVRLSYIRVSYNCMLMNDWLNGYWNTPDASPLQIPQSILPSILSVRDLVHTMSSRSVETLGSRILFLSLLEAFPPLPQDDLRKFSVLPLINKVDCYYYNYSLSHKNTTSLHQWESNHRAVAKKKSKALWLTRPAGFFGLWTLKDTILVFILLTKCQPGISSLLLVKSVPAVDS